MHMNRFTCKLQTPQNDNEQNEKKNKFNEIKRMKWKKSKHTHARSVIWGNKVNRQ